VILDLTGIQSVDAETTTQLLKLAQAVRLLGARCSLSGVSAHLAQTMVLLGLQLTDVAACRTLKDALRAAIRAHRAP
jgi:rsbT co-antagonist protein RsbR